MDRHGWDERYSGDELVWKADPNQFLVTEVADLEPGRALDLATGEGRNAVWLATQGWDVVGADFSATGLAKAYRLASEHDVQVGWVEADVVSWRPPESAFDLVVVFYLHLPVDDRRRALANAVQALAPGATLLLVGHDRTNLEHGVGGPQDPDILCDPDEICADLLAVDASLVVERAERIDRVMATDEGERKAIDTLVRVSRPSARREDR